MKALNGNEAEFHKLVTKILMESGRDLPGIQLKCCRCGERRFARDLKIAGWFGWSELRHVKGPKYSRLCIDCGR